MNPAINADVCLELVRALSEGRMHHDPRCHYRWQPGPKQREPAHLVEPDYVKMSAGMRSAGTRPLVATGRTPRGCVPSGCVPSAVETWRWWTG